MSTATRAVANVTKMVTGHTATVAVLTISGFLIPRILGPDAYGSYSVVMAIVAILQACSSLGLTQIGMRFLPALWFSENRSQAVVLGSTIWTLRLGAAALAGLAGFVWLAGTVAHHESVLLLVGLALFGSLRSAQEATRSLFLPIGMPGKFANLEFLQASLRLPVVLCFFLAYGLPGVFVSLPVLQAVLLVLTIAMLLRAFPLRLGFSGLGALRPALRYGFSAYVGAICGVLQVQFVIFAVATWVTGREAGILAVALHIYMLNRGFFQTAQRSLIPVLSELEDAGLGGRLLYWGELMTSYGAAFSVFTAVAWSVVGPTIIKLFLGEGFAPAYHATTVLLVSLVPLSIAMTANTVLYVRGQPEGALLNSVTHTATIVIGLVLVLGSSDASTRLRIAWVYVVAGIVFFAISHIMLARRGDIRIPLGRSTLLALFLFLTVPASFWEAGSAHRVCALVVFIGLFGLAVMRLGLGSKKILTILVQGLRFNRLKRTGGD